MRLLTVNAGSSSTKCSVIEGARETLARLDLPAPGDPKVTEALSSLFQRFSPEASVHRIVHGGPRWHEAVRVDAATEAGLAALSELAPLHNPPALALLDQVRSLSDRPAVACFDTAFFAQLPAAAATYAVPADWRDRLGIRRYGFHGLSHAWASRRGAELCGRPLEDLRLVTAHLGAGASLAAVGGGRPLDTTMGFTPLEGLVMATRPGLVDPGALTYVLRHGGLSADQLDDALARHSGLVALAGTPDLSQVIERAGTGDPEAALAFDVYLHRLRASLAAMAAALGGLDLVVFTGGAGEGSALLRAAAVGGLGFLGLEVDHAANDGAGDRLISPGGRPAVAVVRAREDLEMARQAEELLAP